MSLYQHEHLRAPSGMAPSTDPGALPENRARYLRGVLPSRQGFNPPALQAKRCYSRTSNAYAATDNIQWIAPYSFTYTGYQGNSYDTALMVRGDNLYVMRVEITRVRVGDVWREQVVFDELTGLSGFSLTADRRPRSVQFNNEVLIYNEAGSTQARIYADSGGAAVYKDWGQSAPPTPTAAVSGTGLTGTYVYKTVNVDELGRESSPSATVSQAATNQTITVTYGAAPAAFTGTTQWRVYRKNPGGTVYYRVATVTFPTNTYADSAADATLFGNSLAPEPGQNDPPPALKVVIACVWKNRVVIVDTDFPHQIRLSNDASPTQFSSLTDWTDPTLGTTFNITNNQASRVTGLVSHGSVLGIFTETGYHELYGDDLNSFIVRSVAEGVGCASHDSIVNAEGTILFLAPNGPYSIVQGGTPAPFAEALLSEFQGLADQENVKVGTSTTPHEIVYSMRQARACLHERRYYLSVGDKTYVYDLEAQGWADTGYGYVGNIFSFRIRRDHPVYAPDVGTFMSVLFFSSRPYYREVSVGTAATTACYDVYYAIDGVDTISRIPTASFPNNEPRSLDIPMSIDYRAFDGAGLARNRRKRAKRFTLWGEYSGNGRADIGSLEIRADNGYSEVYKIYPPTEDQKSRGILLEQEFSPQMKGRLLMPSVRFDHPNVVLRDQLMEYVPLD